MTHDTTPNAHDPRNARKAYHAKQNDIARLIDVLQMELAKHADTAKVNPQCWGKVGDLGKVRSDLIDLVAFISNVERPEIENFLAE